MSGAPASIRSSLGYLQTTSCTLRAIKTNSSGVTSQAYGYFAVYRYSGSSWNKVSSSSSNQSSYTASWASDTYATKFWFGFCTDTTPSPDSQWTVISYEAPVVYDGTNGSDADSSYTIMRDCGYWKSGITYYKAPATTAMNSSEYTKYENYQNMTVVDYVQYSGNTYLAKSTNTNQTPSSGSSYWQQASKNNTLTVNNLLANNAKLGEFSFSNNIFTSSNGKLSMNSNTGRFVCTDVNITGSITATSGTFNGTVNASGGNFNSVKIQSGQIAGFEISGNHIGSSATAGGSGGGLSINPDFIRVGNSTSYVMIGSDTVPATVGGAFTATGRFVNHNYNASTQYGFDSANYGLYVDVANGTKNYALYSPNAAVRAAAVYGDTLNVVSITGSTYKLDMSKGNIIMIRANREYNVNLPNANDVASMFGYKSLPTYFAIHVRIMIHPDTSGVTISGYFRPNNTVNQSVYLHPGNSMGFLVTNYPSFRWVETDYAGQ